ncbi:cupin domain-containing protein [Streptomyces sp. NPDC008238]
MVTHQPGQEVFRSFLPQDVEWRTFPAFPPAARLAVVVGNPAEPAPYVVRVKLPSGERLMPHRHEEDRVYTVISGVFYIGLGETFDEDGLLAYPPGAGIVLPGGTPHFHWAKSGQYITQVTAIGPISLEYVDPKDDPRAA